MHTINCCICYGILYACYSTQATQTGLNSLVVGFFECFAGCVDTCDETKQIETTVSVTTMPSNNTAMAAVIAVQQMLDQTNATEFSAMDTGNGAIVDIFYAELGYCTVEAP